MFSQKGFRPSQLSLVPNNVLKGPLMSTYWLHTDSYFHPRVCWFYFGILLLARNISSSVHHTSVPATHSPAGGFKIGAPSLEWAAFWMHSPATG
jgi:hypothetical protein